jgi:hypothetical protein
VRALASFATTFAPAADPQDALGIAFKADDEAPQGLSYRTAWFWWPAGPSSGRAEPRHTEPIIAGRERAREGRATRWPRASGPRARLSAARPVEAGPVDLLARSRRARAPQAPVLGPGVGASVLGGGGVPSPRSPLSLSLSSVRPLAPTGKAPAREASPGPSRAGRARPAHAWRACLQTRQSSAQGARARERDRGDDAATPQRERGAAASSPSARSPSSPLNSPLSHAHTHTQLQHPLANSARARPSPSPRLLLPLLASSYGGPGAAPGAPPRPRGLKKDNTYHKTPS